MKTGRVLLLVILYVPFLLTAPAPALAQTILSDSQLLSYARSYGQQANWVEAYGYLMAYVQRDPPEMQNGAFRRQILDALGAASYNAHAAGYSGGATVAGKGDAPSATGRPGRPAPTRPFSVPGGSGHPRAYRLNCRGGGHMAAHYLPGAGSGNVVIAFVKAAAASRTRQPGAGQCAWVDRPLGRGEPSRLLWANSDGRSGVRRVTVRYSGTTVSSNIPARIDAIGGNQLRGLITAVAAGRPFSVMCYNNRRGRLVITSVLGY